MHSTASRGVKHRRTDVKKGRSLCSVVADNYGRYCWLFGAECLEVCTFLWITIHVLSYSKDLAHFFCVPNFRFLLNFGEVSSYVGYNALCDFFPRHDLLPNPHCDDLFCKQRQKEYQAITQLFVTEVASSYFFYLTFFLFVVKVAYLGFSKR